MRACCGVLELHHAATLGAGLLDTALKLATWMITNIMNK
jgi:hypothetical protein